MLRDIGTAPQGVDLVDGSVIRQPGALDEPIRYFRYLFNDMDHFRSSRISRVRVRNERSLSNT